MKTKLGGVGVVLIYYGELEGVARAAEELAKRSREILGG